MRIYSAGLDSETNTFTSFPTTWRSFEEGGIWRGNAAHGSSWVSPVPRTFSRLAAQHGFEYVEGLYAAAQPAGPVLREVYEALRDEILEGMFSSPPFDIILLHLHGAMIADGYDDCEGDILSRARSALPPGTVLGAILDPHCHLTDLMVRSADLLIACKHFPHDDYADRAAELFQLCVRISRKEVTPRAGVFDCKMVGLYPTQLEPMAGIVNALIAAERSTGILSVSFIHGFPWGDTCDTGSKMLVYSNGDAQAARDCAQTLGLVIYRLRAPLLPQYPNIDEALDQALQLQGLVVLADTADNAGGGAPGDNVALLSALLRRGTPNAAFASIWDPQIAILCAEAGVGARLTLRLGGKTNASSGMPIDVVGRICGIRAEHEQTSLGDTGQPMGLSAWLAVEGVDIVICSVRSQVFAPDIFTNLGIDLRDKRVVVVKSTNHFVSRFAPIAAHIIRVATPGALTLDFAHIEYTKRSLDYFPRIADPMSLKEAS